VILIVIILSVFYAKCHSAEFSYIKCPYLSVVTLNVIMLSILMHSITLMRADMLIVILPSGVAPNLV
jgi:hypothetical protein